VFQVEGIAVLRTLGWLTVGLVAVLVAGFIVAAVTRAWLVPETGASDYAALTERVSQIEASQEVFVNQHPELTRQVAALQEQVSALAETLDILAGQQSSAVTPKPAESVNEPKPESTGTFRNDNSSLDAAQAVPRNLRGIETAPGQVLIYEVTGTTKGLVWGTDLYTGDSSIAAAAVHAGLLQPDETGTIMVTILSGREMYRGSARYGVASNDYPSWARSYTLQRLQ